MPSEMRYWESIDTAPRDGTEIIVAGGGEVWTDRWVPYTGEVGYWANISGRRPPTHWIPKPPPPDDDL